jgi:hypothetical protein
LLFYLSTHGNLIRDGQGGAEPSLLCADTNLETHSIKGGSAQQPFHQLPGAGNRASERKLDTHSLFSGTVALLNDLEPGAPEPFNNALVGLIVLGEPAARVSADTVLANRLQQLAVKSRDSYSGSWYVSRTPAEASFFEFLSSARRCFTVVGKAGNG